MKPFIFIKNIVNIKEKETYDNTPALIILFKATKNSLMLNGGKKLTMKKQNDYYVIMN